MEKNPFKLLTIRTQNTLTTRSIFDYHLDQVEIIENLDHFPRLKLQKKHTHHTHVVVYSCDKKNNWYAPYEILKSSEEIRTNQLIAKSRSTTPKGT